MTGPFRIKTVLQYLGNFNLVGNSDPHREKKVTQSRLSDNIFLWFWSPEILLKSLIPRPSGHHSCFGWWSAWFCHLYSRLRSWYRLWPQATFWLFSPLPSKLSSGTGKLVSLPIELCITMPFLSSFFCHSKAIWIQSKCPRKGLTCRINLLSLKKTNEAQTQSTYSTCRDRRKIPLPTDP